MKAGDKFTVKYPFKFQLNTHATNTIFGLSVEDDDVWLAGCHSQVEDGCQIAEGYYEQCYIFWCDAEGEIEYEVLAIVPLDGKLLDRVIYRKTYLYPDGKVRKFNPQLMTKSLLEKRIKIPFKVEYDIDPSEEAMESLTANQLKGIE